MANLREMLGFGLAAGVEEIKELPLSGRSNVMETSTCVGDRELEIAAGNPASTERGIRMARILVVDDDPNARKLLVGLLEYEGHVVIECDSGREGMKAAERENPDLVITDCRMPSMSGKDFVAGLRNLSHTVDTPIIFHTAAGDGGEIRDFATAYGVAGILTKPCPAEVLLAEIASALGAPPQEPFRHIPERLRSRIPQYLSSCEGDLSALKDALGTGDFGRIQEVGHNLKGTGSAYGFSRITRIGGGLEFAAKACDPSEITERLRDLADCLLSIKAARAKVADQTEELARGISSDA
jgi:CheY-like chemotaxis protein